MQYCNIVDFGLMHAHVNVIKNCTETVQPQMQYCNIVDFVTWSHACTCKCNKKIAPRPFNHNVWDIFFSNVPVLSRSNTAMKKQYSEVSGISMS